MAGKVERSTDCFIQDGDGAKRLLHCCISNQEGFCSSPEPQTSRVFASHVANQGSTPRFTYVPQSISGNDP